MWAVAPYQEPEDGSRPGGAATIHRVEMEDPSAGPGEVVLEIAGSALNRADLLQMRGLYPPPPGASPVPGLECSGTVVAVGDGVDQSWLGREVMALLAGGGHATRVAVPASQLMAVPEGLDLVEAAALPEVALTSWTNLVYEGRLARGESVLISGAASGVGTFAVQMARDLGARVLVAGRSLERLEALQELGADECLELGEDLPERAREATGGGVDLVIDLVGGEHFPRLLGCLRSRGRLVLVGILAGRSCEVDLGTVLRGRLEVRGSVLRSRSLEEKAGLVASFANYAEPRFASGALRPVIDRVVPFDDVADAYAAMQAGGLFGKLVLRMR
ncbi:MAG: NAD(P)H-quinone oxidoreductase [Acidobacteria bacterium]|nr:MAG: NAD(P)H-quinone oxidoreductase [Acidobacteriota bacterium]REK01000.1 MAG: NAD(P)H-quinone oxidoreductase [Acidobacteriota bacterium]